MLQQPNSFTNDYVVEPIGLMGVGSSPYTGRFGQLTDMWWSNAPSASTFLVTGSIAFAQLGSVMVPWNNTTPVT
jgi:hypothetical protein